MTRIRIEGLLAAFPKLVSTGTQHTYVETENVRYVYTPMEQGALYLLLVTNKQSNILEDLDILRLLGKVVPEYTQQQTDEEGISRAAFDLIFAFDEVIALGHKENVTMSQVRTFTEMESHEEKLHKMIIQSKINDTKDVMKRKALEIDKSKIDKGPGGGRYGRMDGMGGVGVSGMGGGGMGSSGGVGGGSGSGYDDDRFGMGSDELGNRVGGFGGSGSGGMGMGARGGRAEETIKSQAGPTRGLKLGGAKGGAASTNKFLASLAAEGEDMSRASMSMDAGGGAVAKGGGGAPAVAQDGVSLKIEEKLNVTLKKDGGVEGMEVQGTMMLEIRGGEEDAFIRVGVATGANEGFQFKTHPNIDKQLHAEQGILGLKDPNRPFPMGSPLGVLKWRYQTRDESRVPLAINCWPSVSGGDSFVSIEYEANDDMDLHNVVISIPLPPLRDPPAVNQVDGDFTYDGRRNVLRWEIQMIDKSNRNGSMEFVVPVTDGGNFFPINVDFTSRQTLCDVRVAEVTRTTDGSSVKHFGESTVVCENYCVQ